ncbi:transmembrane protein 245-like isoform X4 [Teleopsis dalmanni]|uniref:transmembrane protein 245-like isoform X4 n=1 Tax=Teleopsis dalmanni TaxID=139649 RepID=UPI0018CF4EFE|nr:transmembrane protein 245-like isoform X4 [Teleopsis dalmanni]
MNRSDSIRRDRSFDSVLNKFMRMRSQNNESFRAAMYNFLIAAGVCALVAVCFILGPFVRPLLWAFLMGAVLFPFKKKLADLLNSWFERLEAQDSNVFVSICLGPMEATEHCGRLLVDWFREHWQLITAGFGIAASVKLLIAYAPKGFLCAVWKLIVFSHTTFVDLISYLNIYLLIVIVSIYLTSVYFLWKPELSSRFAIFGQLLWVAIVTYACSFLGAFQVPVLIVIMIYVIVSIGYHLQMNEDSSTLVQKLKKLLNKNDFEKSMAIIAEKKQSLHSDIEDISLSETMDSVETIEPSIVNNEPNISDNYFKFLFYACITTFLYRNAWMCILAAIPISLHLLNTLGDITGLKGFIYSKLNDFYNNIKSWTIEHHSAILPLCLPGILELNYKINGIVRNSLKSSVDLVTSVLMIILMLLIIVFLSVFFCVNIYSETIEVAYMGKDLINKTITNRPELVDILPANIQSSLDDALDNAHHYGRRKIEAYINDWLAEADPVHATKLRDQILDVWDRLIQYWIDFNKSDTSYGPRVPTEALKSTFGEIVDNPGHFKELVLVAKQGIIGWAQSNTQTILEVAESLWHIIRTNLSMIMSFTGDILSLLLSGGQACIEFILDMIVFFTALFYLLASSNVQYAPLQITKYLGFSSSGTKIADALDNSISGVLISLFKCSIFTCLFTWFMHTICGARIVFLPAALAAVLSAAPFLGSYWCALPAFLELWLAQDRFYAGIFLFLMQFFVPPYFEAAIYSEMKGGGHPYLTGLAIAGGMYWFGWQGAIFGPLMLCFFIGMVEIAAVAMRSNDDTSSNTEVVDVIADLVSSSMNAKMGTTKKLNIEITNSDSQDHNANPLLNRYHEDIKVSNKNDLSTKPKPSVGGEKLVNKLLPKHNKQINISDKVDVPKDSIPIVEEPKVVNKLLPNYVDQENIPDSVDLPTESKTTIDNVKFIPQTNTISSTVPSERVELKIISKIIVPQSDQINY